MAQGLDLLRDYIINNKPVLVDGDEFVFGSLRIPKTSLTPFKSSQAGQKHYTLQSVWFAYQHASKALAPYLAECSKQKIPHVSLPDKKELLAYLTGEIDKSDKISSLPEFELAQQSESIAADKDDGEKPNKKPRSEEPQTSAPVSMELDEQMKEAKKELAERLSGNVPKAKTDISADKLPEALLGSGMTIDKIKELKVKRAAKKRTTITSIDSAPPKKPEQSNSSFLAADAAITKDILNREAPIRTRSTVLQSRNKHFSNVMTMVQNAMKEEEKKKPQQPTSAKKPTTAPAPSAQKSGHDRYNVPEEHVWNRNGGAAELAELQIDTTGTFTTSKLPSAAAPRPSSSSAAAPPKLPAPVPGPSSAHKPHQHHHHHAHAHNGAVKRPEHKQGGAPIIIVPGALTSVITIYNAKDFFQDGVFVSSMEKKNQGASKNSPVIMTRRKPNGDTVTYHIVDNMAKFTPKDWERVVAVFALGAAWQFKGWPWPTPVELFSNVKGFYLAFDDDKIPDTIKSWDVKILTINRDYRHLDQTATLEFWKHLDAWIQVKKPHMHH